MKVRRILLPWLLIYLRINVTDGRDRLFGVDFVLLLSYLYLKQLGLT